MSAVCLCLLCNKGSFPHLRNSSSRQSATHNRGQIEFDEFSLMLGK